MVPVKKMRYSHGPGAFGGVSPQGTTLNKDEDANMAVYGKQLDSGTILGGTVERIECDERLR